MNMKINYVQGKPLVFFNVQSYDACINIYLMFNPMHVLNFEQNFKASPKLSNTLHLFDIFNHLLK